MSQPYTLFAHSALQKFKKDSDSKAARYWIPARALAGAMPGSSLLILPEHPDLRALLDLYENVLWDGAKVDVLWTKDTDFQLDIDIFKDSALIKSIQDHLDFYRKKGRTIAFHPYSYTDAAAAWVQQLRGIDEWLCETLSFTQRYADKDLLHAPIWAPDTPVLSDFVPELRVPLGYVCRDKAELLQAAEKLDQRGIRDWLLKPVDGSGGRGIRAVRDLEAEEIEEPTVLCERIAAGEDAMGNEMNCSIEIFRAEIVGAPSGQVLLGAEWQGNCIPSFNPPNFLADSLKQARAAVHFLRKQGMRGMGGFDFMGDIQERSYLIDNNLARETGAHFPKYFQQQYAPNKPFICQKVECGITLEAYWAELEARGEAFCKKRGRGAFPVVWMGGGGVVWRTQDESVQ